MLCLQAQREGWHETPDGAAARAFLDQIDRKTLGRLLADVKLHVRFEDGEEAFFALALKARNRLIHGFFERHNFKIQTDDGRDEMVADLEELHTELFAAWQAASALSTAMSDELSKNVANHDQGAQD